MHRHSRKFDPDRVDYLESEERKAVLDPAKVLRHFDVKAGWTVLDVGCGPGVFTLPLAESVGPGGRVYGVDTEPRMIERLYERIVENHVGNLVPVLSDEDSISLPDNFADFALLVAVLHELDGIDTLTETRRVLKRSGVFGVVDWKKKLERIGPPKSHRLSEEEASSILEKAGFDPGLPFDMGPSHYGFRAKKI